MKTAGRTGSARSNDRKRNAEGIQSALRGCFDLKTCGEIHDEMVCLNAEGAVSVKMTFDAAAGRYHLYDAGREGGALSSFIASLCEKYGTAADVPGWLIRRAAYEPLELAIAGHEVFQVEVLKLCAFFQWGDDSADLVWDMTVRNLEAAEAESERKVFEYVAKPAPNGSGRGRRI